MAAPPCWLAGVRGSRTGLGPEASMAQSRSGGDSWYERYFVLDSKAEQAHGSLPVIGGACGFPAGGLNPSPNLQVGGGGEAGTGTTQRTILHNDGWVGR